MPTGTNPINFSCKPTDGAGVAQADLQYQGVWEKETVIRDPAGVGLVILNNNALAHGGNKSTSSVQFSRPMTHDASFLDSIECHYKAGEWRPDLPWNRAVGRKISEGPGGAAFAWWTPESGGAVPDNNSPDSVFNQCIVTITYIDNSSNALG